MNSFFPVFGNVPQSRSLNLLTSISALALSLLLPTLSRAQTPVLTQHNNNARTGAYTTENILTPANVNQNTFGKLFSYSVDGRIYAQPLYVPNVSIAGKGTHNVIFIATAHDSVYAFDADSNGGANASPLWKITLLDAAHGAAPGATSVPNGDLSTADIVPEIGITGTPVIDPSTGTLYVVGKTKEGTAANPTYVQRLHAINITNGAEKFGGPVTISGSVPGTGLGSSGGVLNFDSKWENNRAGLLLQNGVLYIAFGSHGDNGPWHGWLFSYNASTLQKIGTYCSTPNGSGSGMWMGGAGIAAEVVDPVSKPYGRMFIATGNGSFNATSPYTNSMSYGDDIINLDLSSGVMTVQDSFTPWNQANLNAADEDLGSGGVLLLPDQAGAHTHLLAQVGKEGVIYLVDRDNMGGFNTLNDNIVQEISGQTGGVWGMPAFWNNTLYIWGQPNNLRAFTLSNGLLSTTPTASGAQSSEFPGPTPSVSSNGNTNGIVWAVETDGYSVSSPAILRAYNAANVATQLYASDQNVARDTAGPATKFVVPTIANGKVYVGTAGELDVYGLLNAAPTTATPVISPASQTFSGSLSVTITDSTPGAAIYYTTDGTTPTTASTLYAGPFSVTTTRTITAIASAAGYLQSLPSTQTYTLQNQVAAPVFSPPTTTFSSPISVSLSDATAGASIYYTTNGSTPTTTSTFYSSPITVSATTTIKAIAAATGMINSNVVTATYTYSSGTGPNFVNGFSASSSVMTFNGSTGLDDSRLQLTNGGSLQAGSAWFNTPLNIQSFINDFTFQIANPVADGFTFTIQNTGLTALGPAGGGLGYGPDVPGNPPGIGKSVAIKFDIYNNQGEGYDSTGIYTNGASPTTPSVNLTNTGINLLSGDTFSVHMVYNGATLTMTITDGVTNASYTTSWTINIPQVVGANTAYVGFTGGTGGLTSSQKIGTWTFTPTTQSAPQAATPTFSPVAGTYGSTQNVTISDATAGATIFYTIDGTTPATSVGGSTAQYTGPLTVTSTRTIKAIATASGYSASAVSSATYTIQSQQTAAPTFSPVAGTYSSTQSVSISSATSGASIFYTLNGTTPNTTAGGSTVLYSSPITIGSTTTVKAIATASGFSASNVTTAVYTISASTGTINFGSGFAAGGMIFNGSAALNNTRLRITDGGTIEAASAWYSTPVSVSAFTNDFSFQITPGTSPTADGFAFVMQANNTAALGPVGGGLGYGPPNAGSTAANSILKSIAIKFDLYGNSGETANSTGLYINGASPTTPYVDLTGSGIDLHSGHVFNVHMTYDGANLAMTVTDATTAATFAQSWPITIASTIGSPTAYFGFTGGTGGLTAIQEIISWTCMSGSPTAPPAATPTFSPVAGTYGSTQNVTISDATAGATIFYTIDGTTPATSVGGSTAQYTGPLTVTSTRTIKAIATASGYSASAVSSATYTIQSQQTAAPTFSPVAGTYSSTQSVSISSATSGASIFYTLNGTTPNTTAGGSTVLYSSPITIGSTTTVKAIATASGFSASNVTTAVYTISASTGTINFGSGFAAGGMIFNGSAALNNTRLRITDGGTIEAASAWYSTPVSVSAFTNDFSFQITPGTSPTADGFAFVMQANNTAALGPVGGGLGYGPPNAGSTAANSILKSIAIKFDLYGNSGETANSTGLYINGASPTTPYVDLTGSGIDLHSGHVFNVHMTYDGANLAMTVTDATTAATFAQSWPITIASTIGSPTAYFGFTGGTGGLTAIQEIISWTCMSGSPTAPPAATPTFSPVAGTYASTQSVTISDATAGASIYYTTDGSTPTTSSTKYTVPISVATTTAIKAIATAPGFSASAVASASYTITASSTGIAFGNGFTPSTGLQFNGGSAMSGTRLRLTDSGSSQARSIFWTTPVNVPSFTTDFTFQQTPGTNPTGDGFAFVLQNSSAAALGPVGGGLGYGPSSPGGTPGILKSVAVKFDLYGNAGEGPNSTGLYTNGASPTVPAIDLTSSGVNLHSGNVMRAHITYDGTTLVLTISDTVTGAEFTTSWSINIPTTIGSATAYAGFTGGTGGATAVQDIATWTYASGAPKANISYSTTNLTAVSSGPTFRSITYSGFPDGTGTILDATAVGDSVTFTVNVPQPGTYDVSYSTKEATARGATGLTINGTNTGPVTDQYAPADAYSLFDLGNFTFSAAGNYSVKFTVTGKNASSTSYSLVFDNIILTPQ
jgi:hypothetical protein